MPSYKITYHELPGRAEPTQVAFHIAGVPLAEEKIPFEKYLPIHNNFPLGMLPILTIDDKRVIPHESAVLKYAGQVTGLYPTDPEEALGVDIILGIVNDLIWLNVVFATPDFPGKENACKIAAEQHIPDALGQIEKYISSAGTTYAAGNKLTVADLKLWSVIRAYKAGFFQSQGLPTSVVDKFPVINKHFALIDGHEKVASWSKAHPVK